MLRNSWIFQQIPLSFPLGIPKNSGPLFANRYRRMSIGALLREHRNACGLTQPELAAALSIEQSYLSKIENDKAIPSEQVLSSILDTLGISVSELVNQLDEAQIDDLRQIKSVNEQVRSLQKRQAARQHLAVLACAVFFAVGAALASASLFEVFSSNTAYQYRSLGVVRAGEPKEIFESPGRFAEALRPDTEIDEFVRSTVARTDEIYVVLHRYKGEIFTDDVDGGTRTYRLQSTRNVASATNRILGWTGICSLAISVLFLPFVFRFRRQPRGQPRELAS